MNQPSLFGPSGDGQATANIDGGSRGNPGPAGYGVRIVHGSEIVDLKGALPDTTNNVAEYCGLIAALEWAVANAIATLHIRSDSELLVRQMRGEYRVKNEGLQTLFERANQLVREIGLVQFEHVRREFNKDADRLANEAMDEAAASPRGRSAPPMVQPPTSSNR